MTAGSKVVSLRGPEVELDILRGPGRDGFAVRVRLAALAIRVATDTERHSPITAARLFAEWHMDKMRFFTDARCWVVWDGQRWVMPGDDLLACAAREFRSFYAAAVVAKDQLGRRCARSLGSGHFAASMLAALRADRRLQISAETVFPRARRGLNAQDRFELEKWIARQPYEAIAGAAGLPS